MWELRFRRDGWRVEEGIAKRRKASPSEAWYFDEPQLLAGDRIYMRAFWDLDSERPASFGGIARIPRSKAIEYGERLGLEPDLCDALWGVVWRMDDAYRKFVTEKPPMPEPSAERKDNPSGEEKPERSPLRRPSRNSKKGRRRGRR